MNKGGLKVFLRIFVVHKTDKEFEMIDQTTIDFIIMLLALGVIALTITLIAIAVKRRRRRRMIDPIDHRRHKR